MKNKGQTTIELLLVLSVSIVALTIIYSLYSEQVFSASMGRDVFTAKSAVQKIVNGANTAYFSGAGSEIKVEIEIPSTALLDDSGIVGRTIYLKLSNDSEIIGISDVNIEGSFKSLPGKYVVYLFYDGNVVQLTYRDFELNKYNVSFSGTTNSQHKNSFTIRNNSEFPIDISISKNFSHSLVTLDMNIDNFNLSSNETKIIDLNFEILSNASGNFSGNIVVSSIIDGYQISKNLNISVEVLPEISNLIIYPLSTSFDAIPDEEVTKSFSICNKSLENISSIEWERNGSIIDWFSSPSITSVASGDCELFDLIFDIPSDASGEYDGNFTAIYNDNNSYTALVSANIT